MGTQPRIVVFAKAAVPGRVKTRLCPGLSAEQACFFYKAMAKDVWNSARGVRAAETWLSWGGEPTGGWDWLDASARVFFQEGRDLGERLEKAFGRCFASGAPRVIIIGADCPEIEPRHLEDALELLSGHDLVLGPCRDGGYYLIGLSRPQPAIFKGIAWSTPAVLKETLLRAGRLGLSAAQLEVLEDIDEYEDLRKLAKRSSQAELFRLGHTRRALADLALDANP